MNTFFNQFDDVKSSSPKAHITDTSRDHAECPSYIHFGHSTYTLGFGHLFSGDSQSCRDIHVNRQPIDRNEHRVDQAMQTIRNNVEQQCHSMRNKNLYYDNLNRAATFLQYAANTISSSAKRQNDFHF